MAFRGEHYGHYERGDCMLVLLRLYVLLAWVVLTLALIVKVS